MKVGLIVEGTDHFLKPIEAELRRRHRVERFVPHFVRLPLIGKRVNDLLLVRQLQTFLEQNDVVFCEWAGELSRLTSRLDTSTPLVLRAHRTELYDDQSAMSWGRFKRVIFVSQRMQSTLANPALTERAQVVYNGVDLQRFVPPARSFDWRLGMLGALTPRKRVYDVICALAPLNTPWHLQVGGPPVKEHEDYWVALQTLAARPELRSRVAFDGLVRDSAWWMANIDVYVSASYSEGHQVALLEAMASGCYCLSHCWAGAEEVLPEEYLFVTDQDLRDKLTAYAALPNEERRVHQQRMRAIAEERFDERRMVSEIVGQIESVAALSGRK
ncbi:MAG: glycosyltransferase family 4 protein [Anaerolineae bacterium]